MPDVATLIQNLESLLTNNRLPDDDEEGLGAQTKGYWRGIHAQVRVMPVALSNKPSEHVPARIACELYDNIDTILVALYYWKSMQARANVLEHKKTVEITGEELYVSLYQKLEKRGDLLDLAAANAIKALLTKLKQQSTKE